LVGDLVDCGPRIADTLKTVMTMSQAGSALCVPGNHDIKLERKLEGRDVTVSHGRRPCGLERDGSRTRVSCGKRPRGRRFARAA